MNFPIKILIMEDKENNSLQKEVFSLLVDNITNIHYYNGIKFINKQYNSKKCQIWDAPLSQQRGEKILASLICDMDIILVLFDPSSDIEFDNMIKLVNSIVHNENNKG